VLLCATRGERGGHTGPVRNDELGLVRVREMRDAAEALGTSEVLLLDHPDDYQTMYGHLSRIVVQPGASVAPGQVIGLSGNSGRSTAPHLHFEIRQKGVSIDPRTMVKEGS